MNSIDLASKLSTIADHWEPRGVRDDFFLVLDGRLTIRRREGDVTFGPGELFVVPMGVEHRPAGDPATAAPRRGHLSADSTCAR